MRLGESADRSGDAYRLSTYAAAAREATGILAVGTTRDSRRIHPKLAISRHCTRPERDSHRIRALISTPQSLDNSHVFTHLLHSATRETTRKWHVFSGFTYRIRKLMAMTGQAQILQQASRPQEGTPYPMPLEVPLTNTLAEGETPNHVPMPLLQPRKVRQRLHRKEVRCRQPAVQGLRPDFPDKHQLPQCARRRVCRLD